MAVDVREFRQHRNSAPPPAFEGWERTLAAGPLALVVTSDRPGFSISGIELRARLTEGMCMTVRMGLKLSWVDALARRGRRAR